VTNYDALSDTNISYFLSLDAARALTNAILAGDRNLEVAGAAVKPRLLALTTNMSVGWSAEMHSKVSGQPRGNLLFVDGHVEIVHTNFLRAIQGQGMGTNRLVFP